MPKKSLVLLLVLYIASTALSFGAFTALSKRSSGQSTGNQTNTGTNGTTADAANGQSPLSKLLNISSTDVRDQVCPLNGAKYTSAEQQAWSKRRPLAVMIENSPDARPQSGLSNADVVYEAMAEGGVTRFMAFFYCNAQAEDVVLAPIRSAREYFFQIASGYNRPLYVHVGGANMPGPADALGHIADAGWNGQNDMNQFSIGFPTFVRDYNRLGENKDLATEHTMVTSTEKLWAVAQKRGWTNIAPIGTMVQAAGSAKLKAKAKATTIAGGDGGEAAPTVALQATADGVGADWKDGYQPWAFQDGKAGQGSVNKISFDFWDGFDQYGVRWEYDAATNTYKRFLAGEPHIDLNTKQQLAVANPVVMFAEEKGPIDDKKHMLYTVTGTGNALVFQNGTVIKATWSKASREAELFFKDDKGQPLQFVRGQIWISIVSPTTKITY